MLAGLDPCSCREHRPTPAPPSTHSQGPRSCQSRQQDQQQRLDDLEAIAHLCCDPRTPGDCLLELWSLGASSQLPVLEHEQRGGPLVRKARLWQVRTIGGVL